jgi:bifunctional non-homologous end joining protein LigD
MHCLPAPALPDGDLWVYELMWGGCRSIGHKSGLRCRLHSETGAPLSLEFVELLPSLALLNCDSALVDGEVIAIGSGGQASSDLPSELQIHREIHFVLFDLLMLEGRDLRDKALWERRAVLEAIIPEGIPRISLSPQLTGDPDDLLRQAREAHLDGLIAKRRDLPYECGGRSGSWLKHRAEKEGTFAIGGYIPGPRGFAELIVGERRGRRLQFAGRVRGGFMPATQSRVLDALEALATDVCPFRDLPDCGSPHGCQALDSSVMACCKWVRPEVNAEIAYAERTGVRKLRCPRFLSLAEDGRA